MAAGRAGRNPSIAHPINARSTPTSRTAAEREDDGIAGHAQGDVAEVGAVRLGAVAAIVLKGCRVWGPFDVVDDEWEEVVSTQYGVWARIAQPG